MRSPLEDVPDDVPTEEKLSRLIAASERIPVASGGSFGDAQAVAFIDYWKQFRDAERGVADWLPDLLTHIYGDDRARRLLDVAGW